METRQEKRAHYATADEIQQIKENLGHIFNVDDHGNLTLKPDLKIPVFKMIFVRGGEAKMGAKDMEDNPLHDVKITYNFFLGQIPVTQELYKAITGKAPSNFQGINHPVEQVSWEDAMAFCNVLNEKIGLGPVSNENYKMLTREGKPTEDITQLSGFRLPTESEWEYAAAGGISSPSRGRPGGGQKREANTGFPGSNYLDEVGWYDGNNGYETKPVGLKFPNQLGIYDMSGNVWEWCLDFYEDRFYEENQKYTNPANLSKGSLRVLRGGTWGGYAVGCQVAIRSNGGLGLTLCNNGFRLLFTL
jgi:formylglycine-generating enzyme required for sulfatase activity